MIFKQSVIWNKAIEVLPPIDRNVLVWNGRYMFTATADIYTPEQRSEWAALADDPKFIHLPEKVKQEWRTCAGHFKDFGLSHNFNDPEIYWSELPLAPGENNPLPDPMEGLSERSVFLKKDGNIVGIHAVGYENPENPAEFDVMEIWGNEYDNEYNMLGRGSFRVFDTLENEVKNWEADGWVRFEGPKKKER